MKKIFLLSILIPLFCLCTRHKESDILHARNVYVHYLNKYWTTGDMANIDSALKYNAYLLETDSSDITDYLYRIQMLDLCGRYGSILTFINTIPQEKVSGIPEYKSYLRLKCKAIMAKETEDTSGYRNCLDSIMKLWKPVLSDSIAKTDTILSVSIDYVPDHLLKSYLDYYEIVSLLYGIDSVESIFVTKRDLFDWDSATYNRIKLGDTELTLP